MGSNSEPINLFLPDITPINGTLMDGSSGKPKSVFFQIFVICLYTLVILVAVGGNVIVCYFISAHKRMRTVTNMFIVALSVSDILMAILCIPFTFVSNLVLLYWPFGKIMCPVVTSMQTCAVFSSTLTLVAISFDKFIAVLFPFRQKLTKRNTLVTIAGLNLGALAASLPTAVVSRVRYRRGYTLGMCLEVWKEGVHSNHFYSIAIMMLQYFVPLAVLSFTYGMIAYVIWIKKPPGEAETSRDQRMVRSKRKMVKMMIVVVLSYAVCWLPLHVIALAGDADETIYDLPYMNYVWMCAHWLAMANCCCNPIIYFSMNSKFKSAFCHLFRCLPCVREESTRYTAYFSKPSQTQVTQVCANYRIQQRRNPGDDNISLNEKSYDDGRVSIASHRPAQDIQKNNYL